MLSTTEQANAEVRNNLNTLVQQEMQLLQNSGVTERKESLKTKFDALTSQMNSKRLDLTGKRKAYKAARQKFWDHLNGEQRIEIVTQSDLERNRSQDVIKAKLISECLTQFRTTVKSLYSQDKDKVVNFQLAESSAKNMFRQVQLKAAKVLGIYLSPSEGDIKYTASVAFRFGFEYTVSQHFRSVPTILSVEDVKAMLQQNDFYCSVQQWNKNWANLQGKDIVNDFKLQQNGKTVFDLATNLLWQRRGSSEMMKLDAAEKYIRQLNAEKFADYSGWRLPTLEEAMSLMEPKPLNRDSNIDPIFDSEQGGIWTSDKENIDTAWVVSFAAGACASTGVDNFLYVRAVRSTR